jgi:hypothetical protein
MTLASAFATPAAVVAQPGNTWEIGPHIRGRNYSVGMPLHPAPAGAGWSFDFPYPHAGAGHVHYVTFKPGRLAGASRILVRYRVEAPREVRFVPQEAPAAPATVSLYLQRYGDSWSARRHEFHRWYAPVHTVRVIAPGEHEITVSLGDPSWTSVNGRPVSANPAAFHAALAETERVGLVFGTHGARGHGVFATGPARFRLLSFRIL